jgi:ASC-1-like (ASCH) protein
VISYIPETGRRLRTMSFRATFHFDIRPQWEEAIREGRKGVDARPNIQPYADVKKGDVLRYHSLRVEVLGIHAYPGLNDLLQAEGFRQVVPEAQDIHQALAVLLEEFHHLEPPHGVLALKIRPLPK